jgi:hypothetical protein
MMVFVAMFNAETPEGAVSACNHKTSIYTGEKDKDGKDILKTDDGIKKARKLKGLLAKCGGIQFKEIYDLILEKHPRLKTFFSCQKSWGLELQNTDGALSLKIMLHFARKPEPVICLGMHDSWSVPISYESELCDVIRTTYFDEFGMCPKISRKFT